MHISHRGEMYNLYGDIHIHTLYMKHNKLENTIQCYSIVYYNTIGCLYSTLTLSQGILYPKLQFFLTSKVFYFFDLVGGIFFHNKLWRMPRPYVQVGKLNQQFVVVGQNTLVITLTQAWDSSRYLTAQLGPIILSSLNSWFVAGCFCMTI